MLSTIGRSQREGPARPGAFHAFFVLVCASAQPGRRWRHDTSLPMFRSCRWRFAATAGDKVQTCNQARCLVRKGFVNHMHAQPSIGPWPSLAAALEAERRAAGRPGRSLANKLRTAAQLLIIMVVVVLAASAFAKLPPPSEEARLIATENAAKSAWADKVGL